MSEEKIIYVVVAGTVDTPNGVIVQPCGRIAAQCAHVVSKMRMVLARATGHLVYQPITTIVLSAPSNHSLHDLYCILKEGWEGIPVETFFDTNLEVYGSALGFMTAICTHPVTVAEIGDQFQQLLLWSHDTITDKLLDECICNG